MTKYKLRDEVQHEKQQLQFPAQESNEPSPTTSIYGFAVGFAAGLLSSLGIINFIMPAGIVYYQFISLVLLIILFILNILLMRKISSE